MISLVDAVEEIKDEVSSAVLVSLPELLALALLAISPGSVTRNC